MVILMLTHQPFYIGGIEETSKAKVNAYGALFSFVVSFGVSVLYLLQNRLMGGRSTESRNRRPGNSSHDYEGVPTTAGVMQDYSLNLDLPQSVQEGVFS